MQYANLYKRYSILIACIAALFISGCSTPPNAESPKPIQASANLSEEELAQLKASSQQWQAAKAGVERLLVIEQDLKLLISQLNAVAKQGSASTNTPEVPTAKASAETVAPKVAQKAKVAANTADEKQAVKALFALQVAAVTDKERLSQSLNQIKASASSLFQGEFVANVETINVSGMTYYRLKLGAYQNQANAAADCDRLKQRQINCIVSHYTQQPLK
ncbi:Sporulation related domain protein [Pseudoalteromonas sp. P1-16-1b]|uniref:SPOR domain-containing protein n=1 Tax=Pseudoalteromonas sp. P1-16-1b TaxID=1723757 RepID=UPI0006D67074|nr:SPOR domain-containing protein [Pseudoalteromonas sp. P1-16-1b]KPZ63650.1 Sporulation related domain protein [Pseudoalteromonas sp. P1-16-1b]